MYQAKSSLEVAVEAAARVDAVLAKKGKIKPNPIATALATANKSTTDLFQTEFEINDVPITARNLLTKGITQEEINHFSGASISTRGRYLTPEDRQRLPKSERPLYLFIQGPNKQSLDLAIQRIDSLIKEVMEQEKIKMGPPPPLMTMQTSLPGLEKVIVGLDTAPPTFDVRNKVLGPGGANLQYISNETGAVVTLRGRNSGYPEAGTGQESLEPLHICVEHQKIEVLQAARQLAFNLVDTIQQEFAQLYPQGTLQPGSLPAVSLQPEQLPPGMVATSIQMPVLTQQPTAVSQLVNMPPPSLGVPPPQLVQQPPPVTLPPPGIHIPAHQGPLVPQQQGVVQQTILQQPPPNVAPSGLHPPTQPGQVHHQVLSQPPPNVSQAPPTTSQQTQAFITHATYPVQYIQAANGQTLMAYQTQPQMKADGSGQVQLIQTQPGQHQQLQLIPGTQQLLMQQPQQQVTMLLQYQQQNEPGKGGRVVAGQQRVATPLQIQLQPGVQLLNPQLLQSGQTQFQLQLQQPLAQQLLQQAVRAVTPQQVTLQQTRQVEQQQHIIQLQQQQNQQVQQLQLQQSTQQIQQQQPQHVQQQLQQQLQSPQQLQQSQQQLQTQLQPIQQQLQLAQQQIQPQLQHQLQQSQQQQLQPPQQQQLQPPPTQQQLQPPQQQQLQNAHQQGQQTNHLMQHPQQQPQQMQQQIQQTPPQIQSQQNQQQQIQQQNQQQQIQQNQQQQIQQNQQQQIQQQIHQQQQQIQQQNQQQQIQQQNQHLQVSPHQQTQQTQQGKETLQQRKQQLEKPNQSQQNQQQSPIRTSQSQHQQQQGQKRRYEDEQRSQNMYQGPPQPVPPPKVPPPKQVTTSGIGNGPNVAQKPSVAASTMSQLLPQIQKQLMPPPPPPQPGAPDDWRNNQPDQMNQANRGEQHQAPPQGARQERPTFNHYSSKPQLYNANMPFHMQGLGTYPPPPPPPPPVPYYSQQQQQQPQTNQYSYFMMHHQQ